jgi:hypothetical protein
MAKKNSILEIEKIRDFIAQHPNQLFIVCNPASDEIFTSYAGKYSFVKFKEDQHVLIRVVSPDMFELAIDEFASMLIEVTGSEDPQFIKTVGGSVKAIGESIARDNPDNYAKETSKKRGTRSK